MGNTSVTGYSKSQIKFHWLAFNPANQKVIDFLDELHKLATNAFGVAAQAIIEHFIYAKKPPHLKKSNNRAHFEHRTYAEIVSHLGMELKRKGLRTPGELQINTVTQQATQQNPEKSKPTCHNYKKNQVTIETGAINSNERNNHSKTPQKVENNNNGGQINSNSHNKISNNTNANNTYIQKTKKPRPA